MILDVDVGLPKDAQFLATLRVGGPGEGHGWRLARLVPRHPAVRVRERVAHRAGSIRANEGHCHWVQWPVAIVWIEVRLDSDEWECRFPRNSESHRLIRTASRVLHQLLQLNCKIIGKQAVSEIFRHSLTESETERSSWQIRSINQSIKQTTQASTLKVPSPD